ncbi:MAG: DNRLRE domain-containing protein [Pseudorhodobacter sp.]|nr:DNRLRE domain-containing protein [Frankiaceae bacterium]
MPRPYRLGLPSVLLVVASVSAALATSVPALAAPSDPDVASAPTGAGDPKPSAESAADRPATGPGGKAADGELVGLRTATSRTFAGKDGRLQARLYNRPVNHRGGDGSWQKNDTRLDDDGAGGGRNKAGAYDLSLPKTLKDRPVTVSVGPDAVGFRLDGAAGTLERQGSIATYRNALPGVDLEYQAQDAGVKETLVLGSAAAPTSFRFAVSLSKDLTLTQTPEGGLVATDLAGAERLRFSAPSVQDASSGAAGFSTEATTLRLTGTPSAPVVTLELDRAWLQDPARVFPVRLDPSYDSYPTESTYLNSGSASTNFSAATTLRVGVDTAAKRNNTLLKYDTSVIPRDVSVDNAYLFLDVVGADANAAGSTIQAKAVTRGWAASLATWATYDGSNIWTTPGGDVTGTGAATATFAAGDTSVLLQPLGPVSEWVSGARVNNGLQISSTSALTGSSLTLAATTLSQPL